MTTPAPDLVTHQVNASAQISQQALRWHVQREAGAMWGMRFTFAVLNLLGRKGVAPIVYLVVLYFFLFGKKARQASRDYLSHIHRFAPEKGIRSDVLTSFRHFMNFASAILDKLQAWQGKIDWDQVNFSQKDELHELTRHNIGGLLIGAHLGNMELCRALGSLKDNLRITVLVHTKHAQNFNRLLAEAGADSFELIQVTEIGVETALRLQEKIQAGEWIVIMGDRVPVKSNRYSLTTFLGDTAAFPQGPFILASLMQCPVSLMFCLKEYPGKNSQPRHRIVIEPFAEKIELRRKYRDLDIKAYIDRYAERLQAHCLNAPLQWYNFYHFWKQHV